MSANTVLFCLFIHNIPKLLFSMVAYGFGDIGNEKLISKFVFSIQVAAGAD